MTIGGSPSTGCTFAGIDSIHIDGCNNTGAQIHNFNFTYNTVRDVTAAGAGQNTSAIAADGYLVNSNISWNTISNIWNGGYQERVPTCSTRRTFHPSATTSGRMGATAQAVVLRSTSFSKATWITIRSISQEEMRFVIAQVPSLTYIYA